MLSTFRLYNCIATLVYFNLYLNLQIQAAVVALRNTRGLPWPKEYNKKKDEDILDWLQAMFGFQVIYFAELETFFFTSIKFGIAITYFITYLQKDNVANQREHLILLLANVHIRQFPKPDQQPKVCEINVYAC